MKTEIRISSDGTASWLGPVYMVTECIFDVETFPFDSQACPMTFGPFAYPSHL